MTLRLLNYNIRKFLLNPFQLWNSIKTVTGIVLFHLTKIYFPSKSPLVLMMEPTNLCNFNCPLCDKGAGKLTRPEGIMSVDDYKKIIQDAGRGLKMLMLWNQGEPFVNNKITEFVRIARKRNIFTIISTNGSLLSRNAEKIIGSGLDELIISLDGAKSETYDIYRQGGEFAGIVAGAKELVRIRGKKLHPLISLQFLLLKQNIDEIPEFEKLAEEIGADRVLWKTVQVGDEEDALKYLPVEEKFTRYRKGLKLNRRRNDCRRILFSAMIDWNGNMVPCCFDKNELFMLGNVIEQGFEKTWRGNAFTEFRRKIARNDRPDMCSNCTEGLEKLFL